MSLKIVFSWCQGSTPCSCSDRSVSFVRHQKQDQLYPTHSLLQSQARSLWMSCWAAQTPHTRQSSRILYCHWHPAKKPDAYCVTGLWLRHTDTMDHSIDLLIPDSKKYKKGMDRSNKKFKISYHCMTPNTSAKYQCMLHIPLTNLLLLAAKPGDIQKRLPLNAKHWRIVWKNWGQMASTVEKR